MIATYEKFSHFSASVADVLASVRLRNSSATIIMTHAFVTVALFSCRAHGVATPRYFGLISCLERLGTWRRGKKHWWVGRCNRCTVVNAGGSSGH